MKHSIVALIALVLAGCTSINAIPVSDNERGKYFTLNKEYVLLESETLFGKAFNKVSACRFNIAFKDQHGEYYLAENGCFYWENLGGDGQLSKGQGGIFVPSKEGEYRGFAVVGGSEASQRELGSLVGQLDTLEWGRIDLHPIPLTKELKSAITIVE